MIPDARADLTVKKTRTLIARNIAGLGVWRELISRVQLKMTVGFHDKWHLKFLRFCGSIWLLSD